MNRFETEAGPAWKAPLRRAAGVLLRTAPVAAVLALATWVLGQGVEVKTSDTASDVTRFKIPTTGVGTDADVYFDNANLGVGTSNPAFRVHVLRTADPAAILIDSVGVVAGNLNGRRANGVIGGLTPVLINNTLAIFGGMGYGSTAYSADYRAALVFGAAENWTDAAHGTYQQISTTTNGTTSRTQRLTVTTAGRVGIGVTNPDTLLEVSKATVGGMGPRLRLTGGAGAGAQTAIELATYAPGAGNAAAGRIIATDAGSFTAHLDFQSKLTGADANALQDRMRVRSNGNIGIGTTDPQAALQAAGGGQNSLAGNAATGVFIDEDAGGQPRIELRGSAKTPYIDFANDTGVDYDARVVLAANNDLRLQGANLRLLHDNWSGMYFENTVGRTMSLENNTGLGGGGGLRVWDQTGGGLVADFGSNKSWTIEQGGTIRWSGGTGTNMLDFNKGGSRIFDDAQLKIESDDNVIFENASGGNLTQIIPRATNLYCSVDLKVDVFLGTNGGTSDCAFHGQRAGTVMVFNRTGNDGWIVANRNDGTNVGVIAVAGATVSYNPFTGSHYARSPAGERFERWTLLVSTGDHRGLHGRPFGTVETVYGVATTDIPEDPRVLGAYLDVADEAEEDGAIRVAAVGNGFLLVTDAGGDIRVGDYLTSSRRPGHGQRQASPELRRYTVAKAMESVDWSKVPVDPAKGFKWKRIAVTYKAG